MNVSRRKAVSPIIATLLLIAITVAAGIIVYVFVNSLSGSLTKSGGNQVTEEISMDAYNFQNPSSMTAALTLTIRNTGTSAVTLLAANAFYYNGTLLSTSTYDYEIIAGGCYVSPSYTLTVGSTCTLTLAYHTGTGTSPAVAGTSHPVKIVTADGGTFTFNVIAGGSS